MSEERTGADAPRDDLELADDFDEPEVDELDEGEAPPDEGAPEEIEEAPPQRRARPGPRERRERAELRELREEQKRLRDELAATRQTYQQAPARVDPYEAQRQEQAWREQVSLLAPDQQIAAYQQRTEQRLSAALQQQERSIKDQIDRNTWESMCRSDTLAAKYRDRVDALAATMAPGAVPRELIFEKLLGEDIRKRRTTELPRQRREAAARVRQQTVTPAAGRSDGARSRADANDNSVEASRRRIAGKSLW